MKQSKKRLKGWPKTVVLDEETMLAIAKLIAYTIVGSKPRMNAPPDMSKPRIEESARLVDKWLIRGDKNVS